MKRTLKKCISLLLTAVMMFGVAPLGLFALKTQAADTTYQNGDIIEFGSYPQSEVKDSALLAELNKLSKTWISYGYYIGTGYKYDGQMTAEDYMKYADVTYNGNKYRAVTFSSYRPYCTGLWSSGQYTYQNTHGYNTNTTYWFKYEPVKWRVLNSSTGLVICETIIDSQAYNNYCLKAEDGEYYGNSSKTYYAINYEKSSIREWLNDDFYNTAFTSTEKNKIKTTTLNNSPYSGSYSKYNCAATNDKVFLLSYKEVAHTSYFENITELLAIGSDYAKCQGLTIGSSDTCTTWLLRSGGETSQYVSDVTVGQPRFGNSPTNYTDRGIRPALTLDSANNNKPEKTAEITIKKLPTKTEYIYKQDALDLSGIELLVTYSDGTTETVTDTEKMTITGFSNTVIGEQTVTVEYEGMQTSFKVNVKYDTNNNEPEKTAEITIKKLPTKTEYIYKQDALDLSGIELLVTYSDGTTETVTDTEKMTITGFSNTVIGEQTVTVEYEGMQTSFKVNVKYDTNNNEPEKTSEITIKKLPAKTEYIYKQDALDLSGIELLVTYSDGTTETVTDTERMTITGFSNTVRGEQTVTVEYEGLQTAFKVNVKYVWWQWIIVILLFGWIWY